MKGEQLIFSNEADEALSRLLTTIAHDKLFVLCDSHTVTKVLPRIDVAEIDHATIITIPAGDNHKDLESLSLVWRMLSENLASRHSLLINIGGGMVTDLGGFAAATFKRGMAFVNLPTTLLGAVDAAVGGKTGINFGGMKNEIGAFAPAYATIVSTGYFDTLPPEELRSGYAEMIKHALLSDKGLYYKLLDYDIEHYTPHTLLPLLQESVRFKQEIVGKDPQEGSLRKILNIGHTIGHAFESHALHRNSPIAHGYAVAWGLVCELLLAHRLLGFPTTIIYDLARYVEEHYGSYAITCDDYDELYRYMLHDKKNENGDINFVLLQEIGQAVTDCHAEREEIEVALDVYRDLFHL